MVEAGALALLDFETHTADLEMVIRAVFAAIRQAREIDSKPASPPNPHASLP